MKLTSRIGLAGVLAGVASVAGVSSAAAADSVPLIVPLEALENGLPIEAPTIQGAMPLPAAGRPAPPQYTEGRLMPQATLPQIPLSSALPAAAVDAPLKNPLSGERMTGAALEAAEAPVEILSPGLGLESPLVPPEPGRLDLPGLKAPELAVLPLAAQAEPAADALLS
ncbi:hypothetical protein [Streptomyces sp. KLOTTS4A1]|uniref:hypothetical protein n=1 Tax=Streptomyces sp. KLOTTS4A1 TaxID=3390996 RepID=UPI0039F504F0